MHSRCKCIFARLFVFFAVGFVCLNHAYASNYSGVGLPVPLSFELEFNGAKSAVIVASQESADYVLSFSDRESGAALRQVNISSHRAISEVLFVEANECRVCVVSIRGREKVDRNSPYDISVNYLTVDEHVQNKTLLQAITQSGQHNYDVLGASSDVIKDKRRVAVSVLKVALNQSSLRDSWFVHAQSMLLQILGKQHKRAEIKILSTQIMERHQGKPTTQLILSYYDSAALESDQIEKGRFYRLGIDHAKALGHSMLLAKGTNSLAINFVKNARFGEALGLLEESRAIYVKILNWRLLMKSLHNLSWASQRAGKLRQSISYAAEQKLLAEKNSDQPSLTRALYDMAVAYGELGERYEADLFIDQALDQFIDHGEEINNETITLYGFLLLERANGLFHVGDYESARDSVRQAITNFSSHGLTSWVADAQFLEGEIVLAQKKYDEAYELLNATIQFDEQNHRYRSAGLHYLRVAEFEMKLQNATKAASYQSLAMTRLSQTEDFMALATALGQAIEMLLSFNSLDRSSRLAERAADFIMTNGRHHIRPRFVYSRALIEHQKGNEKGALQYLSKSRQMIEASLPKVRRRDLRRNYLALQKSVFELTVEVLIKAGRPDQALQTVESYKARTLNEVINTVRDGGQKNLVLSRARKDLHREILESASQWYEENSKSNDAILMRARELKSKLERVETELDKNRRSDHRLTEAELPPLPQVTREDEAIAYYFIGEKHSWVWLITKHHREAFLLPSSDELVPLINQAKRQISTHPALRKGDNAWEERRVLTRLGEMLIGPLANRVFNSDISNLIIIPDGPLHGLPFAPLRLNNLEQPLVANIALSYVPSNESRIALNRRASKRSHSTKPKALILADPLDTTATTSIERLPHSLQEAKRVSDYLGDNTEVLSGEEADKNVFLDRLSDDFDILHFATHGLLNSAEPTLSGLVFSKLNDEPNYWLAPEISSANFSANLVVLSACQSSIGKEIEGEGLLSLSRAFIEGGASHVVGTLWKVEDASSAELVSRFYSHLLDDSLVVSKALQRAQLSIYLNKHNDWRDPYFWAGFQLQGGWHTLAYGSNKGVK